MCKAYSAVWQLWFLVRDLTKTILAPASIYLLIFKNRVVKYRFDKNTRCIYLHFRSPYHTTSFSDSKSLVNNIRNYSKIERSYSVVLPDGTVESKPARNGILSQPFADFNLKQLMKWRGGNTGRSRHPMAVKPTSFLRIISTSLP